ncbi:MAG TPA: EscU/YscU/HrcU family type III secretion system export apparatus switch protein [Polyangia bacterium]|nr:EscU/YscU/HrcU family type III secretion system export apparatus switch protein [Polyangia bacterium]
MARGPSEDATEEPTSRRWADARRRGEVAFSRELSSSAALATAVVVLAWDAPALVARAAARLRRPRALKARRRSLGRGAEWKRV